MNSQKVLSVLGCVLMVVLGGCGGGKEEPAGEQKEGSKPVASTDGGAKVSEPPPAVSAPAASGAVQIPPEPPADAPVAETAKQDVAQNIVSATQPAVNQLLEWQRAQGLPPDWVPPVVIYVKDWLKYFEDQVAYQIAHPDDKAVKAVLGTGNKDPFYISPKKIPWYADFILSYNGDLRYYHGMFFNAGKPIGYYVNFSQAASVSGDNQLLTYFAFSYDEVEKKEVHLGKGALFYNKAKTGQNGLLIQHIHSPAVRFQLVAGKQDFKTGKMAPAGQGPYNILMMMVDGAQFGSNQNGKILLKRVL